MFIAGSGFYLQGSNNQLAMVRSFQRRPLVSSHLALISFFDQVVTGVYLFAAWYGPGAGASYTLRYRGRIRVALLDARN